MSNPSTTSESSVGVSLDARERIALFLDSDLAPDYILSLPLITFDLVREHCASTDHLRSANLSVVKYRRMGASTPAQLRLLGFDAADLRDEGFCVQMVNEYGEEAVQLAFVDTPSNVRKIAGSPAMDVLKLSVNWAIGMCKADPINAMCTLRACIEQVGVEATLMQLSMPTLTETGLKRVELTRLGITIDVMSSCMHATDDDLRVLNYTFCMS